MFKEINGDIIQWLRGFYAVALSGSFSKGAGLMKRDRSSVFYQVGRLEEVLQVTLFSRSRQGVGLTKAGKSLLKWTEDLFARLDNIREVCVQEADNFTGRIVVGASNFLASKVLVPALSEYYTKYPGVEVEIVIGQHLQYAPMIESGEMRFALTLQPYASNVLRFEPLLSGNPTLVAPKEAHILKGCPQTFQELAQYDLLTTKKHVSFFNSLLAAARSFQDEVKIRASANNEFVLLEMLKYGLGVAIVPSFVLESEKDWLEGYDLKHLLSTEVTFGIVTRKNDSIPEYVQDFIYLIKKGCAAFE